MARGERGDAGIRCILMMEHHGAWWMLLIEGKSPKLGHRRVYYRDGCSSIGPCRGHHPRIRAAPIFARQHLIHTAATLSYLLFC